MPEKEKYLDSKDIEKITQKIHAQAKEKPEQEWSFLKKTALFPLLFPLILLFKIPWIKNSIGAIQGRYSNRLRKEQFKEATELILFALKKFRHKNDIIGPGMHFHWWSFMADGVDSADHIDDTALREQLIEHANNGIMPLEGYDVAHSFLTFAQWRYEEKHYSDALRYAHIASDADSTWAEPDLFLGRHALFQATGKEGHYFKRAIGKDYRVAKTVTHLRLAYQNMQDQS